MSELRQDPSTHAWVIIATHRAKRPQEFRVPRATTPPAVSTDNCVFCPGNESRTPPELWRIADDGNSWAVRVIPNKYAALSPDGANGPMDQVTMFRRMRGFGYHEVIVETPHHNRVMALMQP